MQQALTRHKTKDACVIPILLRPYSLEGTPFENLQPLPSNKKPVTSWRQEDEAFVDIVEGILKVIEVLKTQHPHRNTSLSPIENLPYERNSLFTGREELLEQLHKAFHQEKAITHTYAISGLGGIGKTQTALEYANRYKDEYETILWINADTDEQLLKGFNSIAHLLELPGRDEQDQSLIMHAVKRWLQQHQRWLLILDNADDLSVITKILPLKTKEHILITTRSQITGRIAQHITIKHMNTDDGTLFLLRRATLLGPDDPLERASEEDQRQAREITRLMGGLPLALDQAGAYIEETKCSLKSLYFSLSATTNSIVTARRQV